jgi:hypothetical protein
MKKYYLFDEIFINDLNKKNRLKEIANKAESLLSIKNFSVKFEKYVNMGWFAFSEQIWYSYGKNKYSIKKDEKFICDFGSVNMLHYETWKDTDAIEVIIYFLDTVISDCIDKSIKNMEEVKEMIKNRKLEIGLINLHCDNKIKKEIENKIIQASRYLTEDYGSASGLDIRNQIVLNEDSL